MTVGKWPWAWALTSEASLLPTMSSRATSPKAAAGFLTLALRPTDLVFLRVKHGEPGAIRKLDVATVPELVGRDVFLHAIHEMGVDFVQLIDKDFRASLAVSAGVYAHAGVFLTRKFSAQQGHDFANRFTAGSLGCLDLIEEAPKNYIQREDAPTAVLTLIRAGQQSLRNVGPKCAAKLGKGTALRELGKSFHESRYRRFS